MRPKSRDGRLRLRILLTNNTLDRRAGTELVVLELARALRQRGHQPVAYSTALGEVAEEIRLAGVPVISSLDELGATPDLIHGQHHLEGMTAMLRYPDRPAIYVCNGWSRWEERPPRFSSIMKYVAVGDLTRERVLVETGIGGEDVEVIGNFVDIGRFALRHNIAPVPKRAVIFSNYVVPGSPFAQFVTLACQQSGIEKLTILGSGTGRPSPRPEVVLEQSDLVFAVGRSALEAMAMGCAVIVAHPEGLAGMVTMAKVEKMRLQNFGLASLDPNRLTVEALREEMARYDADEIAAVSRFIRRDADLELAVDRYLQVYEAALTRWRGLDTTSAAFSGEQLREASRYLEALAPRFKNAPPIRPR